MKSKAYIAKWLRFLGGALLIFLVALFFASGYTPPGVCGEVVRNNQQNDIDASPFFYGDVENMLEIIECAEQMHRLAGSIRKRDSIKP